MNNRALVVPMRPHEAMRSIELAPRQAVSPFIYGNLTVYFGSMFSGKTAEIEARYDRAQHARIPTLGFKPRVDTRFGIARAQSRRGNGSLAFPVHPIDHHDPYELLGHIDPTIRLVIIDEAQFFAVSILTVVDRLRRAGIDVCVAGLDLDFLGRPFGYTLELAAHASEARKLTAICMTCCSRDATFTQMIDRDSGQAITHDIFASGSPLAIEGETKYEARCGYCFVRPTPTFSPAS